MNRHVKNQATTLGGVGIVRSWAERIASDRLKGHRTPDVSGIDQYLCLLICSIKTAHETDLEWYLSLSDHIEHAMGRVKRQGQWFFAKNSLARLGRGYDQFSVCLSGCGDHHCLQFRKGEQFVCGGCGVWHVELTSRAGSQLLSGLCHRVKLHSRDLRHQRACVQLTHPAQSNNSNLKRDRHRCRHPFFSIDTTTETMMRAAPSV